MKKITLAIGLALALLLPATVAAKPSVDREDRRAAKAECKSLRGKTAATREAFLTQYRNLGACVRSTAREEAQQEESAHKNAAKECKAERQADPTGFAEQYGTGPKGRNALGKCVSSKSKEKEAEADQDDQQEATEFKNAAKECAAERDADAAAFAEQYGTEGSNRKNAFGKCVSQKVREDDAE